LKKSFPDEETAFPAGKIVPRLGSSFPDWENDFPTGKTFFQSGNGRSRRGNRFPNEQTIFALIIGFPGLPTDEPRHLGFIPRF
jgi:hypothetical protein